MATTRWWADYQPGTIAKNWPGLHLPRATRWWADYQPGTGNLQEFHPLPAVVEQTPEATKLLIETRQAAEAE
ncbi:MAG: hypothetical protein IT448_04305, partial [Phycisphaerales bacterium]|nr:hypothetical protein [Phycisphaerales bacterium]